jgi:hypothetical protein
MRPLLKDKEDRVRKAARTSLRQLDAPVEEQSD